MRIQAYFEHWNRRPGDTVRLAISSPHPSLHATLERITSGPGDPQEAFTHTEPRTDVLDREVKTRVQPTAVGSYADLPLTAPIPADCTLHLTFMPTLPALERSQVIAALGDVRLELLDGVLRVSGTSGSVQVSPGLDAGRWYSIALAFSGGEVTVDLSTVRGWTGAVARSTTGGRIGSPSGSLLRLATATVSAIGAPEQPYNGKVGNPTIYAGTVSGSDLAGLHAGRRAAAPVIAAWDLAVNPQSQRITETVSGQASGTVVNGADRGVTGWNWSGRSDSFKEVPEEYGALQFHDDDMVDANWSYDLEFTLPEADLQSGVYCVRLEGGGDVDRYPLFVLAPREEKASVLFLLSTHTYLAYGNDRLAAMEAALGQVMPHKLVMPADEEYLHQHAEFGRSCYDTHSDGTPVRYSSRRRPLVNVRPGYPNWLTNSWRHFPQDLFVLEWLEKIGVDYHIATDEDVDREGADLFSRYRTVVTCGHPEYWTWPGLDALETYLGSGGKIMYLGGNGFYWVTSTDPERPWIIEVRRDNSGTRCWDAPRGERTHVFDGVPGGLWRLRGRGPNTTVGVGFASEGWAPAQPFKRLPASREGRYAAWFDGIPEAFGDEGIVLGGVAGDEIDRWDLALGSPPHATILATADGFDNEYQLVIEDQLLGLPDQGGPDRPDVVRADMIHFTIDGGGEVFSGSSISYSGALAWNDFDNPVATLTTRVLRDFIS